MSDDKEVTVITNAKLVSISLVNDSEGATGFILTAESKELFTQPIEVFTSSDDLQYYPHGYDRRIYTVKECKCGRDEHDPIHGVRPPDPDPDRDHPFDRRDYSPFCKCGKPLWESVHDVYKWEQEKHDE